MASNADIESVIDNIEPNYAEYGWDDATIVARLDGGSIPERVIASYWIRRANQVLVLVNTSESGSSRGNDALYPRFKALAEEWDAKAIAIENPTAVDDTRGRLGSFPIRRV